MGYRGRLHVVAAARTRPAHGSSVSLPYGWRPVRDADDLCEGCGHVQQRDSRPDGGRPDHLQAAHPARLHDLPDFAVYPDDSHMERCRRARLSVPALSDRPDAEDTGEGADPVMSVLVNGVEVVAQPETSGELGAVWELLRQRAVAVGLLEDAAAGQE